MITKIDKFGRIIIPKKFRKRLGINFNTTLNISENGNKIEIEPIQDNEPVINKDGILVFTGKLDDKKVDIISKDRNKRIHKLLTNND